MSKIEWTEKTINPILGCTKISAGCKNCYALAMSRRLASMNTEGYAEIINGQVWSNRILYLPEKMRAAIARKKPTLYFLNSMSDTFHEGVSEGVINEILEVIQKTPQHTWLILTKRAQRMADYFSFHDAPANVWLGVTVENVLSKDRIEILQGITVVESQRFLSIEPLLEDLGVLDDLTGIRWVIVGGESGKNARPMKKEWVTSIQKQCIEQGIDFFFKQWGAYGEDGQKRSKKSNGSTVENQVFKETPLFFGSDLPY